MGDYVICIFFVYFYYTYLYVILLLLYLYAVSKNNFTCLTYSLYCSQAHKAQPITFKWIQKDFFFSITEVPTFQGAYESPKECHENADSGTSPCICASAGLGQGQETPQWILMPVADRPHFDIILEVYWLHSQVNPKREMPRDNRVFHLASPHAVPHALLWQGALWPGSQV